MNKKHLLSLSVASAQELHEIYKVRHDVYAHELGQYQNRQEGSICDPNDVKSTYIVARVNHKIVGFVGVTSPYSPRYSIEKYKSKQEIACLFDQHLYEIRTLTVIKTIRGSHVAAYLMYAAFRWVESHGGQCILSMGHENALSMYLRCGFKKIGQPFSCGAAQYYVMTAKVKVIALKLQAFQRQLSKMKSNIEWKLDVNMFSPSECYHGGQFFEAIGNKFDDLDQTQSIINADVLDAWFPPPPIIQKTLNKYLPWVMRTSPPTRSEGLTEVIAASRGVQPHHILTGSGSSSLIFLAFRHWLTSKSRVLIIEPSYGEYAHILDQVIQCQVKRFTVSRCDGYKINLQKLSQVLQEEFDLFVWVNPNSPTGLHVTKPEVKAILQGASGCKRIWIDETYIEYVGSKHSLEPCAVESENLIVCKSMSKVYALSGLRVAYLCASAHQLEELRHITPPWSVSLPAQLAATYALQSKKYYDGLYEKTHALRERLIENLRELGIEEIIQGQANFIMLHLPGDGINSEDLVSQCRALGLYIRDVSPMGKSLGSHAIRIAVKDEKTNQRIIKILKKVLSC